MLCANPANEYSNEVLVIVGCNRFIFGIFAVENRAMFGSKSKKRSFLAAVRECDEVTGLRAPTRKNNSDTPSNEFKSTKGVEKKKVIKDVTVSVTPTRRSSRSSSKVNTATLNDERDNHGSEATVEGGGGDAELHEKETEEEDGATSNVGVPNGLSEYELARLDLIRQNQAMMASLGLDLSTAGGPRTDASGTWTAKKRCGWVNLRAIAV